MLLLNPTSPFIHPQNEFVKEKTEKLGGKINVESSLKTFYKEVKNVGDFTFCLQSQFLQMVEINFALIRLHFCLIIAH